MTLVSDMWATGEQGWGWRIVHALKREREREREREEREGGWRLVSADMWANRESGQGLEGEKERERQRGRG